MYMGHTASKQLKGSVTDGIFGETGIVGGGDLKKYNILDINEILEEDDHTPAVNYRTSLREGIESIDAMYHKNKMTFLSS